MNGLMARISQSKYLIWRRQAVRCSTCYKEISVVHIDGEINIAHAYREVDVAHIYGETATVHINREINIVYAYRNHSTC